LQNCVHELLQDIRYICVVKDVITFCATIPNLGFATQAFARH
jgi:hypothetical protein